MDFSPFLVSLKLAAVVTALLLIVGLPTAYVLAFKRVPGRTVIETILTLPLVLPPTVLGFYLLVLLSPNSAVGGFFERMFGMPLVFSFPGIVIASFIYSFPFVFQPLTAGFQSVDRNIIEASATLGKTQLETVLRVIVPAIRPSIITATAMSFGHTIGEFGTVLMIGGNIPGVTRVASIAVYDKVEQLDFMSAHWYALALLAVGFCVLFAVHYVNRPRSVS